MSELPERTEGAMFRAITAQGWTSTVAAEAVEHGVSAAMNPALGPDRLVVAGPFEREIIEKVCAWLEERSSEGRRLDMPNSEDAYHWAASAIASHFAQPERTQ